MYKCRVENCNNNSDFFFSITGQYSEACNEISSGLHNKKYKNRELCILFTEYCKRFRKMKSLKIIPTSTLEQSASFFFLLSELKYPVLHLVILELT